MANNGILETPLAIERLAFGGAGIGRLANGKVCFVPRVIPGEKVMARIRAKHASYVEADLEEIVESSPDRIEPKCPVYGRCGGCQYQHLLCGQLAIKDEQVAEVLRRLGGIPNPPVEPMVPSRSIPLSEPHHGAFQIRARWFFRSAQPSDHRVSQDRHQRVNALLLPCARHDRRMASILREPSEFQASASQRAVADRLLEIVEEMARPGGRLLVDAYCGAGFFARRLAAFELTIGIE